MTSWHADEDTLARYTSGEVPLSVGASVEAHLLTCAGCRGLLTSAAEADRLERLWHGVQDRVDAPQPGPIERLLRLIGVSESTARLLVATPALRASWLFAMAVALTFAVLATVKSGVSELGTLLFLTAAPVLPVAGVAAAFHRGLDPTYEIGLAVSFSQFRLLLLRSAAVTAVTCPAVLIVGVLLPQRTFTAAAWLLPALALTSLTLVLAGRVTVVYAATGVGMAWVTTAVAIHLHVGRFAAFGAAGQLACLAVAAVSLVLLVAGRDRYATNVRGV